MSLYSVIAKDGEGYTVGSEQRDITAIKREAIRAAKLLLGDEEFVAGGMVKAEILDSNDECEWEDFV